MTPQERQLIDDLFDRLSKLESAPRDPDATAAIAQGLRKAPSAVYALVQTVLVQDEALRQAHHRIEELEAAGAPEQQQQQSGGFLDSMRDAIFGQDHGQGQSHGSVPNVPPRDMGSRDTGSRPVWNSGQVMPRGQYPDQQYNQGQYNQGQYGQPQYGQPYGAPQGSGMGSPMGGGLMGGAFGGGGGGSFLGTAAATAAGMVGGSLLLNSFRGMMGGGSRQGFGDPSTVINERVVNESPWSSDQSRSGLARDAGVNDVNKSQDLAAQDRAQDLEQDREDDNSRSGLFDTASNNDDHDDMDSDDFGNDGNSDYA
jgi:uncharacterized protein